MGADTHAQTEWQALAEQALAGDDRAFERLWQEYLAPNMRRYAQRLVKVREDAEDMVQEVFVYLFDQRAYRKITRRDLEGLEHYVGKMVYNMAMAIFRKQRYTRFVVTSRTLEQLRLAGVPADALAALETLCQQRPVGRQTFIDLVAAVLRQKFADWLEIQRLVLKYSRFDYARTEPLPEPPPHQRTPHTEAEFAELLRSIADIRAELSAEEWEILNCYYRDDAFSFSAYARETGIAVTTLHSRFSRARQKLVGLLRKRGYGQHDETS